MFMAQIPDFTKPFHYEDDNYYAFYGFSHLYQYFDEDDESAPGYSDINELFSKYDWVMNSNSPKRTYQS